MRDKGIGSKLLLPTELGWPKVARLYGVRLGIYIIVAAISLLIIVMPLIAFEMFETSTYKGVSFVFAVISIIIFSTLLAKGVSTKILVFSFSIAVVMIAMASMEGWILVVTLSVATVATIIFLLRPDKEAGQPPANSRSPVRPQNPKRPINPTRQGQSATRASKTNTQTKTKVGPEFVRQPEKQKAKVDS